MQKLRDLLMKRLNWDGEQATEAATYVTGLVATYIDEFVASRDATQLHTVPNPDCPLLRHMVITVSEDRAMCHLRLYNGNDLIVDFDGLSAYNPTNARSTIRVPAKVEKAGKALRG